MYTALMVQELHLSLLNGISCIYPLHKLQDIFLVMPVLR
jgi:hypothetical protein